jgi:hypothetical protein
MPVSPECISKSVSQNFLRAQGWVEDILLELPTDPFLIKESLVALWYVASYFLLKVGVGMTD